MIKFDDVHAGRLTFGISLSKLTGKKIADVIGYVTMEFGEPTFQVSTLVFEDGTEMAFEGEHDLPYVVDYKPNQPNCDAITLRQLYDAMYKK